MPTVWKMRPRTPFLVLVGFLIIVFLTGGGSRDDISSLVVLRPIAVLVCGYAVWLRWGGVDHGNYRPLFLLFGAVIGSIAITLIPLPPALWQSFPGRQLIVTIDHAAGLGDTWRPISLVPSATWNALYSAAVPLAVLLLAIQLDPHEHTAIAGLFLIAGLCSAMLAICQLLGPPDGPFYLYRVTNNDAPVGLFANRNHFAIFFASLLPLAALWGSSLLSRAKSTGIRPWLAGSGVIVAISLLLISGSRAGIILGALGLLSMTLFRSQQSVTRRKRRRPPIVIGGAIAIALLVVVFVASSRSESITRILAAGQSNDQRFQSWGPIAGMAWKYFPVGSGPGSFDPVFRIDEPYDLLSSSYLNHAHNDWLEVVMTGGILGFVILIAAAVFVVIHARRAWVAGAAATSSQSLARGASVALAILALGSIGDYPLRIPSIAAFAVMLLIWLRMPVANSGRVTG